MENQLAVKQEEMQTFIEKHVAKIVYPSVMLSNADVRTNMKDGYFRKNGAELKDLPPFAIIGVARYHPNFFFPAQSGSKYTVKYTELVQVFGFFVGEFELYSMTFNTSRNIQNFVGRVINYSQKITANKVVVERNIFANPDAVLPTIARKGTNLGLQYLKVRKSENPHISEFADVNAPFSITMKIIPQPKTSEKDGKFMVNFALNQLSDNDFYAILKMKENVIGQLDGSTFEDYMSHSPIAEGLANYEYSGKS